MKRSDLPSSAGGRWTGLVIEVERPACPAFRVEVTGGRRLLLRQRDRVVLLGRQRASHRGVHYARTGLYRSPLPPIDAADARNARGASGDDDSWAARWAHQFTDRLRHTDEGPLHTGRWSVARGMPKWSVAANWPRLRAVDPDLGHITWFGYGDPEDDVRDVLPLRRLSPPDAGRVKSYRRQFREGVLPPVLLWWVSGLNTLLVLDGHDRIAAALAEDAVPEVVVLAPAADPVWVAAVQRGLIRQYEERAEHQRDAVGRADTLAQVRIANAARQLAEQLDEPERAEGRTRAWPMPGGPAAWDRYAATLAPGWAAGSD